MALSPFKMASTINLSLMLTFDYLPPLLESLSLIVDESLLAVVASPFTFLNADNALFLSLKIERIAKMKAKKTTKEGSTIGIELPRYGTLIIDE